MAFFNILQEEILKEMVDLFIADGAHVEVIQRATEANVLGGFNQSYFHETTRDDVITVMENEGFDLTEEQIQATVINIIEDYDDSDYMQFVANEIKFTLQEESENE